MEPLLVLAAPSHLDLSPLTKKLWAERIVHRVVMDKEGRQCLILADVQDLARVKEWVMLWQQGQLATTPVQHQVSARREHFWLALARAPLSMIGLLLLVLIFIWMHLDSSWQTWLTAGYQYWPNQRFQLQSYLDMGLWDLWRPVLLHFSLAHMLFNGLWWWILAPQIERLDGKIALLALIFVCGLLGNAMQWWYMGPAFGGASGITMGMLGWVGVRLKQKQYPFPKMLLPAMVVMMLLSITADTLFAGITGTAQGAHVGGLIAGLVLGLLWPKSSTSTQG